MRQRHAHPTAVLPMTSRVNAANASVRSNGWVALPFLRATALPESSWACSPYKQRCASLSAAPFMSGAKEASMLV